MSHFLTDGLDPQATPAPRVNELPSVLDPLDARFMRVCFDEIGIHEPGVRSFDEVIGTIDLSGTNEMHSSILYVFLEGKRFS